MKYIGKTFCRRGLEVITVKAEYKGTRRIGDKFLVPMELFKEDIFKEEN